MHTFLRAIGFSKIKDRKSLDALLGEVMAHPDIKKKHRISMDEDFVEMSKKFGDSFGITIRGTYDEKGFFHVEHYFPYLNGITESIREEMTVSKKSEDRAFAVMCDDIRLGVLLIFYLQNTIDYIKCIEKYGEIQPVNIAYISGLSIEGKIILPVLKNSDEEKEQKEFNRNRNKMISEARNGDQDAIESLAVDDIDTYMEISKRALNEDLYSIVDTSFYPYGSESDNYSIIGTIKSFRVLTNSYSGEIIFDITLDCNDVIFNICINQQDLYGTPMVGARFKGSVWLQGRIDF